MVGSHQLAKEYAMQGHTVLHISTPVTLAHLLDGKHAVRNRLAKKGIYQYSKNLYSWVPFTLVPWPIARWFLRFANLFSATIWGFEEKIRNAAFLDPDLLLVDEPRLVGMEKRIRPCVMVYRPTDIYWSMRNDISVMRAEKQLLFKAKKVIATSRPVLDHILSLESRIDGLILENGYDSNLFPVEMSETKTEHRGIYYGSLDKRFDKDLCIELAKNNPAIKFDVYSPDSNSVLLEIPANLKFYGSVPYNDLPKVLKNYTFGFLPFVPGISNDGRSPMKLYEMYSCGLPVFSTETAELTRRRLSFLLSLNKKTNILDELICFDPDIVGLKARNDILKTKSWSYIATEILKRINYAADPTTSEAK